MPLRYTRQLPAAATRVRPATDIGNRIEAPGRAAPMPAQTMAPSSRISSGIRYWATWKFMSLAAQTRGDAEHAVVDHRDDARGQHAEEDDEEDPGHQVDELQGGRVLDPRERLLDGTEEYPLQHPEQGAGGDGDAHHHQHG